VSRFRLHRVEGRLCLAELGQPKSPVSVDFDSPQLRARMKRLSARSELLLKALGGKAGETVVDMTTGLGTDTWLLATFGYTVYACERSPTLYAMLEDGLQRVRASQGLSQASNVANNIRLRNLDSSLSVQFSWGAKYAVIDPMFPVKRKQALASGDMQMLQRFVGRGGSVDSLLQAAKAQGIRRAVVKRALRSRERYALLEPLYSLEGRSTRFDVFQFG
jgi:16S rRNA (guanine1516-N2)-methyltransferase